jgi:hypothetical protein
VCRLNCSGYTAQQEIEQRTPHTDTPLLRTRKAAARPFFLHDTQVFGCSTIFQHFNRTLLTTERVRHILGVMASVIRNEINGRNCLSQYISVNLFAAASLLLCLQYAISDQWDLLSYGSILDCGPCRTLTLVQCILEASRYYVAI